MNAPKKRQSDDRNSHIASLALVTPVWVACGVVAVASWPVRPGTSSRGLLGGDLLDRRHQRLRPSPGSRPQANMPNSSSEQPGDRARVLVEHRGVAEARAARAATIERVVRRRRHVDAVPVACAVGSASTAASPPHVGVVVVRSACATSPARRRRRRPTAAAPAGPRRPRCTCGATSRRGPRPPGSRRSCTRAAATGSTTRASGRPTGRRRRPSPRCVRVDDVDEEHEHRQRR